MLKILIAFTLLSSLCAKAKNSVVYGNDDREEIIVSAPKVQFVAQAVAAQFHQRHLSPSPKGFTLELPQTLGQQFRLCEGERFREQPIGADCSAFLVEEDVLVTAGHCFDLAPYDVCEDGAWVFGYQLDESGSVNTSYRKKDVYTCERIIAKEYGERGDFAVVKLDRPVVGRTPLAVSTRHVESGDSVAMVGFPSGLPMKAETNGKVLASGATSFSATLDAFQGNSGSVVFDQESMEVVGILVAGNPDYTPIRASQGRYCNVVNTCSLDGTSCEGSWNGLGERISGMAQLNGLLKALK